MDFAPAAESHPSLNYAPSIESHPSFPKAATKELSWDEQQFAYNKPASAPSKKPKHMMQIEGDAVDMSEFFDDSENIQT
jgi:hypothetical protein